MSSSSPTSTKAPVIGEVHDVYGYKFRWTEQHQTEEQLKPLLYTCDSAASEVLERVQEYKVANGKTTTGQAAREDLYELVKELAQTGEDEVITKFWDQVNTVPDWVDWEQIKRGQDVFYRYAEAMLIGGTFSSLIAGMGASRIAETLARTGGFAPRVGRKRLIETTQHLLQCTMSLDSIKPGGEGHIDCVRVRLLHASVRRRILGMAKIRPEYYNVEKFGLPINDQDTIATIATYSAQAIWLALPSQGIYITKAETADYIHLWRLVAWYMGTPDEVFATPESAKAYLDSALEADVKPTEISKTLALNVIAVMADQPPSYPSKDFLHAQARVYNGQRLSDDLGIPKASYIAYAMTFLQCFIIAFISYFCRSIPALDKWRLKYNRKQFWELIVAGKHGLDGEKTKYKMQYIPEFDTVAKLGKAARGTSVATKNFLTILLAVVAPVGGAMYVLAK